MNPQHKNDDVVILGTARSAKLRVGTVHKAFPIYKKQYWIARDVTGTLEFYKNDQDPQAKGTVRASQIVGVTFAVDKQNKFFDLCVQLRGGVERRFRLSSREERSRWFKLLTSIANKHSALSQLNAVMSAIRRRLAAASQGAPYRFYAEMEGISSGAPIEVIQCCIEAVDRGIEFAHSIAKTFAGVNVAPVKDGDTSNNLKDEDGGEETNAAITLLASVPFVSVHLVILRLSTTTDAATKQGGAGQPTDDELTDSYRVPEGDMQRAASAATRYDPSSKQLNLAIVVAQDASTGDACFRHMPLSKVVSMLQSNVWRNPVIEGWLSQDRQTQLRLDQLDALIHESPDDDGSKLQSSDDENNVSRLSYDADQIIPRRSSISDLPRRRHRETGSGARRASQRFTVTMQWGHDMDAVDEVLLEAYLRERVSYLLLDEVRDAIQALLTEFPTCATQERSPTIAEVRPAPPPSARECFQKYVVGVAVCLDRTFLEEDISPPLELLHRMWGEKDLNSGSIVVTKLRRRADDHRRSDDGGHLFHSIGDQLRELVLTCRLSHAFRTADLALSKMLGTRDGCRINWESFVTATRSANVDLQVESLPDIAINFMRRYAPRADRLVRSLKASRSSFYQEANASSFYDTTFLPCVSTVSIEFISRESHLLSPAAPPSIRSGIFCDTAVLWNAAAVGDFDDADGVAPIPIVAGIPMLLTFQIPMLSPWMKGYFSNPGNMVMAPDRNAPQDAEEDEDSSDDGVPDLGDAVASERKVETQVLDLQQVINLVYDAQQGVPVPLKVGSGTIREAIDALQSRFTEGPISKHTLVRIYTMNLQRLRELFTEALREENVTHGPFGLAAPASLEQELSSHGTHISRHAARKLLKDYCEYVTTESQVDAALHASEAALRSLRLAAGRAGSPFHVNAIPPTATGPRGGRAAAADHRAEASSPTNGRFDFETVASIALLSLLPLEAEQAIRSRRDILWLGLEDTGKTLLINSIRGVAQATHPTIGLTESVIAFKEWVFGCKELGGRAWHNWRQYMDRVDNVHAVVFVIDAGKVSSFGEVSEYLHGVSKSKQFRNLPFLVIFNNYRFGDRKAPSPQALYDAVKLSRIKKDHQLQYVMCDVTVVHSKLKTLSADFEEGLNWVCQILSADSAQPPSPKHR